MDPATRVRKDARFAAAITLFATAVLASYVAHFKQGPDEFFPAVTYWKNAQPMARALPDLAMIAMVLGALALMTQSTGLQRTARFLCACAFPAVVAAMAILPNAPPAFAFAASVVSSLAALAVLFV